VDENVKNCKIYNPKISIVVACYNSAKFVETAVKSVIKQTYKNWEIIICDDASTDKSYKVIKHFVKNSDYKDRIKILKHGKNHGYGKTLRDVIESGNGELIGILDSDDALASINALKVMIKKHEKHPEASLVYSNYYECDVKLSVLRKGPSRQLKSNESYLNTKIRISHFKVFKRSLYNKTDGVNPNLRKSVDKDLNLKLEEVGKLIYVNRLLYFYRNHQKNLTNSLRKRSKSYRVAVNRMRKQIYVDAKKRRGLL